ncbi:COQ9 family protein [Sphingomonas sp. CGMCC 1.13654]|uniref:COQ9 family protein n=1 Tax=Sphingomonas chungangi TaxID=2683589 RepID=A0A838LBC4_9SPHN|nr:COQ9 family protein [Sphingomonas chungangi]MBA2935436.1 COQ9 family protein [Sphingomonas chungangi]MVW56943.1 COQ9 family protein [Sphingomonas chungangi]
MAAITLPTDPTLDEMRLALGAEIPAHAVFDGWSDAALEMAAQALGLDPAHAKLAFLNGAVDMIDAWYASLDARLALDFPPDRIAAMKFRERISALVLARIALVRAHKQAVRSALAILARPRNLGKAAKFGWRTADALWRIAGDTATDFNHYTKRMTLSAVYGSTLLAWLDDESEGEADTRAFLARRIDNVMQFEKLKTQFTPHPDRHFSVSRFLGRLRYPAA